MKKTKLNQKPARKANRRFAAAPGYLAKGSNLGELALVECFIEDKCKEMRSIIEYLERIAKAVARIRAEIKENRPDNDRTERQPPGCAHDGTKNV